MRVAFTDFDGVLNSADWTARRGGTPADWLDRSRDLDPTAVARLNVIVEGTGAGVVISSSWRIMYPLDEIEKLLSDAGFRGEIVGVTPCYRSGSWESGRYATRAEEIRAWLDEHPDVESFVILDDDGLGEKCGPSPLDSRLVRTNILHGLQPEHVEAAIEILLGPHEPDRSARSSKPGVPGAAPG